MDLVACSEAEGEEGGRGSEVLLFEECATRVDFVEVAMRCMALE